MEGSELSAGGEEAGDLLRREQLQAIRCLRAAIYAFTWTASGSHMLLVCCHGCHTHLLSTHLYDDGRRYLATIEPTSSPGAVGSCPFGVRVLRREATMALGRPRMAGRCTAILPLRGPPLRWHALHLWLFASYVSSRSSVTTGPTRGVGCRCIERCCCTRVERSESLECDHVPAATTE